MRKKFLCLLLIVIFSLTLVACNTNDDNDTGNDGEDNLNNSKVADFKFVDYNFDTSKMENYSKDSLTQYSDSFFKGVATNIKSTNTVADIANSIEVNEQKINTHSMLLENIAKWKGATSYTAEQTKQKFRETTNNYYLFYTSVAKVLLNTKDSASKPLSPLKITHTTDTATNTEYYDTFKEKDTSKISITNYIDGAREVYMNILVYKDNEDIYLDGFSYVIENNMAEIRYIKIDKDLSLVIEYNIDLSDNNLIFHADKITKLSINYYNINELKGYAFEKKAEQNSYLSLQSYDNLNTILNSFNFSNYQRYSARTIEYLKSADIYDITPIVSDFLNEIMEEMNLSNLEYDRIMNS